MLKLKPLSDTRLFRPNSLGARRVRLLGFRRRHRAPQRPSWNYRKEDGGGIIVDMLCHLRYVLDNLFGEVKAVSCLGATHIQQRWDEHGKPYDAPPTIRPTRRSNSKAA